MEAITSQGEIRGQELNLLKRQFLDNFPSKLETKQKNCKLNVKSQRVEKSVNIKVYVKGTNSKLQAPDKRGARDLYGRLNDQ